MPEQWSRAVRPVVPPAPGPVRLQVGERLFIAVPAERARAVAYVLTLGAEHWRQRDGVAGLDWLDGLLALLRLVHSEAQVEREDEHRSCVESSAGRTAPEDLADEPAWWVHDHITVAEAARLTGWTPSYLARLGRAGYGVKRAGAWHLDRHRLLARAARRRHSAGGTQRAVHGARSQDSDQAAGAAAR